MSNWMMLFAFGLSAATTTHLSLGSTSLAQSCPSMTRFTLTESLNEPLDAVVTPVAGPR